MSTFLWLCVVKRPATGVRNLCPALWSPQYDRSRFDFEFVVTLVRSCKIRHSRESAVRKFCLNETMTFCMQNSPSWAANSSSVSQLIPSTHFMQTEGLLPHLQEPTTRPYWATRIQSRALLLYFWKTKISSLSAFNRQFHLTLRRLMSYIYIYIYTWSTHSWCF